ncbi:hypothetical protein [Aquisphaera insulae]|uniref:hypothetical protein n=1 Tax=Aquisphaera insulae TaxID=2712864 RepID=UPI0013EDD06A|nr:hypothetical protein [Aquisphaera insulae]
MARGLILPAALLLPTAAANAQATSPPDAARDDPDTRIGLADLPAYRAALADGGDGSDAKAATFRDLWDHPEAWKGRRVEVRGRVARIFRQDPVGSFPALAELWLGTADGDLFCAHCPIPARGSPAEEAGPIPDIGTPIHFKGIYLKTIRYAAGDEPRLAPLIVGGVPPAADGPPAPAGGGSAPANPWPVSLPPAAWAAGAAIGLAAAGALAWRHLKEPPRPAAAAGAVPGFLDEGARR